MKIATIQFDITRAERTIAWFYSGVKQSEYQKASLSVYSGDYDESKIFNLGVRMVYSTMHWLDKVVVYSAKGTMCLRLDD